MWGLLGALAALLLLLVVLLPAAMRIEQAHDERMDAAADERDAAAQ